MARPRILLLCAAVAATLLGPRGVFAQSTVPQPIPKRPSVQLTMDEVRRTLDASARMLGLAPAPRDKTK